MIYENNVTSAINDNSNSSVISIVQFLSLSIWVINLESNFQIFKQFSGFIVLQYIFETEETNRV